ncbi:rcc1 repeat-containing protein [Cyclospora cayetanensis]|uniref:Rcc1 repeat-containing protein n=1 Tax=Cyclospora cayetanensis TaxID=88456 RepID=A0A1D3CR65_9EIME|nr:rcc1 repeat-containing protein [Cyclospora cayetanensis]
MEYRATGTPQGEQQPQPCRVLFAAEAQLPLSNTSALSFKPLWTHPCIDGILPKEHNSCSRCESSNGTERCRLTPSASAVSSFEDCLVLAFPDSLRVFIRQASSSHVQEQSVHREVQHDDQQHNQQHAEPDPCFSGVVPKRLPPRIEYTIPLPHPVSSVACGLNHILVATRVGIPWALGSNSLGQLGDGTFQDQKQFTRVKIDAERFDVVSIHAGCNFSLAVCIYRCGGYRSSSQEGSGRRSGGAQTPQQRDHPPQKKQRVSGAAGERDFIGEHGSADKKDVDEAGGPVVFAWGSNEFGELGLGADGMGISCLNIPKPIASLQGGFYTAVACGSNYSVFVTKNGKALSFGLNTHGQLGHGTHSPREDSPSLVRVSTPLCAVSCTDTRAVALSKRGRVITWGLQLTYAAPPPVRFPALWSPEWGVATAPVDGELPMEGPLAEPLEKMWGACTPEWEASEKSSTEDEDGVPADASDAGEARSECEEATGRNRDVRKDPFCDAPAAAQVVALPPGIYGVAATGVGIDCVIARGRNTPGNVELLCLWDTDAAAEGSEKAGLPGGPHRWPAVSRVAHLPAWIYTREEKAEEGQRPRRIQWNCRGTKRTILIWAQEAEADEYTNQMND